MQRLSLNLYMYDIFTVVVKKIGIMFIISLTKRKVNHVFLRKNTRELGKRTIVLFINFYCPFDDLNL